jgi:hypothetical protein
MNKKFALFLKGLILENPVLVLVLGTCPTLAITTSVIGAICMGLAATAVLICSNAVISALLDYLQGDPEEFEKGKWWEYVLSAIYGPLASMPGIGEAVAALGTGLLKGVGYAFDIEELQKARTHAGAARAILDVEGAGRAVSKVWEYLTDDEEHGFAEYSRELSKFSRTIAIGTGWLGNAFGYWSTVAAVLMNPVDLAARMYRNFQHYYGEE